MLVLLSLIIAKRFNNFTGHSFTARLEYLCVAAAMIKAHPFFGSGLNTFGRVDYYFAPFTSIFSNYAHNSYAQLFAETGSAGFLAFMGIIFCVLRYGIELLRNIKGRDERLLSIGIMWAITSFFIDNLFNCTLLYPQTSIFWWVALAIMFSFGRVKTQI